ncbi:hypothetical protein ACWD4L_36445 [Streptomyces sp. NPDC002596]
MHGVAHEVSPAPPKWKATLVTMLGAYPVAYGTNWLLGPQITAWPLPRTL